MVWASNNGFCFLGLVGGTQQPRWSEIRYEVMSSGLSHPTCHALVHDPLHQASAPKSRHREKILYVRVSPASRQIESTSTHPYPLNLWPGAAYPEVLSPEEASRDTISLVALAPSHWIGKGFHSPSTRRRGMVCSSAFAGACQCKPIERLRVNL
jgi:hypothetical protein